MKFQDTHTLFSYLELKYNFILDAPVDIDRIAELLGLEVVYDPTLEEEEIVGAIFLTEDDSAQVLINPIENSYEPRRRFTLAHEIGHFCLHLSDEKRGFIDNRKSMSRSNTYWDKYEGEANSFAANLLMPKKLVLSIGKEVMREHGSDGRVDKDKFIGELSAKLQVSAPALTYRLQSLGVLQ